MQVYQVFSSDNDERRIVDFGIFATFNEAMVHKSDENPDYCEI